MAQKIAGWVIGVVWLAVFCAFMFAGIHGANDNEPLQFPSTGLFAFSLLVAVCVHVLCRLVIKLAENNWRPTGLISLAFAIMVPLTFVALLKLGGMVVWLMEDYFPTTYRLKVIR
jgi:hypothetical protein